MAQIDLSYDMDDLEHCNTEVNVSFNYTAGKEYTLRFFGSRIEVYQDGESIGFTHFSKLNSLLNE